MNLNGLTSVNLTSTTSHTIVITIWDWSELLSIDLNVETPLCPKTVDELYRALDHARMWTDVGVVILTGNGPSEKDGGWAFCSGGDQRIRGKDGYQYKDGKPDHSLGRLHILEVQRLIRFMPKVVKAVVPGWAVGGGHSLHVVCDLTIASKEHAIFKQTDPDVASFDSGYGSAYLARQVGQKTRTRNILPRQKLFCPRGI